MGPRVSGGIRRKARIKSCSHFLACFSSRQNAARRPAPGLARNNSSLNKRNVTGLGRTGEFSRTIWLSALGVMANCRAASACDQPEAFRSSRNSCFKSIPAIHLPDCVTNM